MSRLNRRHFLHGLGGLSIALPLFASRGPRAAAATSPPLRFLVFIQNNGTVLDKWRPQGTEDDFTMSPILKPLESHKRDLLIIDGLDSLLGKKRPGPPHMRVFCSMLTGDRLTDGSFVGSFGTAKNGFDFPNNVSIDQKIAQAIGTETEFLSLELGVQVDARVHPETRAIFRKPKQPLPPENDPRRAFERIFSGGRPPGSDPEVFGRLLAQRRSALDHAMGQYRSLIPSLASEDAQRLELHLDSLREVEARMAQDLEGLNAPVCESAQPPAVTGFACSEEEQADAKGDCTDDFFEKVGKAHMDLLVQALSCDLTRVASLMWSNSGNRMIYGKTLGLKKTHHDLDHSKDVEARAKIATWYSEQFAYLINRLANTREPDGSRLLDHTVVLWATEFGDPQSHSILQIPHVLAGQASGRLRTGRYLQFKDRGQNDLFASLLKIFGIDEPRFGPEEYNRGALPL